MRKALKEIWKVIDECPRYSVSNLGRVINNETNTIKKLSNDKDGYKIVLLYHHGKSINRRVHRLVAKAFLPNPLLKPEVNHKNCNKLDNTIWNLEWVTGAENIAHAMEHGKIKVKSKSKNVDTKMCKTHGTKVRIIETGEIFESVKSCADAINGKYRKIFDCLNPKVTDRHTHRGYHFERID